MNRKEGRIKGNRSTGKEPVNIRRFAVSRYKTLEAEGAKMRAKDWERWKILLAKPLNKWILIS